MMLKMNKINNSRTLTAIMNELCSSICTVRVYRVTHCTALTVKMKQTKTMLVVIFQNVSKGKIFAVMKADVEQHQQRVMRISKFITTLTTTPPTLSRTLTVALFTLTVIKSDLVILQEKVLRQVLR